MTHFWLGVINMQNEIFTTETDAENFLEYQDGTSFTHLQVQVFLPHDIIINTIYLLKGVTYRSAVGDNCMRSYDSAGYLWYDTNCDEYHQVLCEYDCGNVNNINVTRNCKHRLY